MVNAWVQDCCWEKGDEMKSDENEQFPNFSSFYLSNFTSFNSAQQGASSKSDKDCIVCITHSK